jgi:hypothetical protein
VLRAEPNDVGASSASSPESGGARRHNPHRGLFCCSNLLPNDRPGILAQGFLHDEATSYQSIG